MRTHGKALDADQTEAIYQELKDSPIPILKMMAMELRGEENVHIAIIEADEAP
jgi:hypothetical protein